MRWNIGRALCVALAFVSSTLSLFDGIATADTTYWVKYNISITVGPGTIEEHPKPLIFFGLDLSKNINAVTVIADPILTNHDQVPFENFFYVDLQDIGVCCDPIIRENANSSIGDAFPVGSRPDPSPLLGPSAISGTLPVADPAPPITYATYAWEKIIGVPSPTPVAVNETATTSAGVPVPIDLSKGATGNPTSAAVVSKPAHGAIGAVSGTKVTYTPTACFAGTDSFQFTLANASGKSNIATATITVTATPTTNVHLVDPFLLGQNLSNIDLTPLYNAQNWSTVQAKGLVADDTSAAIAVIQTNDCKNAVTFTTTNGTTLLPYKPNFLTTKPAAGGQSLTIPAANLLKTGGLLYAAALVQAPVGKPAPSFTAPIVVTAKQGTSTATSQMAMVPPPIVLVHGLWADQNSLAGTGSYLKATLPWHTHPELVQALCYSKSFAFDALTDPLSKNGGCELTSKDAIFKKIEALKGTLDKEQIVGSRVDVVAHSMGGLAARWYASQEAYKAGSYRYLANRKHGAFHKIITLNTPELGSLLANFLDTHSNCTAQKISVTWSVFCKSVSPSKTVAQCFAGQGDPLAAPGYPLNTGAVYSLFPDGASLKNPKLSGPNITDADWYAVSSIAPGNSALEFVLNAVIAAIYPSNTPACQAKGTAPNISQILGTNVNDAIVTLASQLAGQKSGRWRIFGGLSHTGLQVSIPGQILSDANVLASASVDQAVCKWLSPNSVCPASLPASLTQVSASETSPVNKNAVPMPQISVAPDRQYLVDRLTFRVPANLALGTPFDLAVNTGSNGLPEIRVVQRDMNFARIGSSKAVPVSIVRVEGPTVYLSVTPEFFGDTEFQVVAAYRDGGVAFKDFTTTVNLPSVPPTEFHADALPFAGIRLDSDNPSIHLQPWAVYADIPGQVNLDARYVAYIVAPAPSQVGLSRSQRALNMQGAFRVTEGMGARVEGRAIVLIDDVMTSGATVNAASRLILSPSRGSRRRRARGCAGAPSASMSWFSPGRCELVRNVVSG